MKKHTYPIGFVVLFVLSVILLININKNSGSIKKSQKDFSVNEINKISKVKISTKNQNISLANLNGKWTINNLYDANTNKIKIMLSAFQRFEIITPISKAYRKEIIDLIYKNGTKIEIFSGKKTVKCFQLYYRKDIGTYMILKKSRIPFIIKLTGYSIKDIGRLLAVDVNYWRNNIIINMLPEQINSIQLDYPNNADKSYNIIFKKNESPQLLDQIKLINPHLIDIEYILSYRNFFVNVYCKFYILQDSVKKGDLFAILTLESKNTHSVSYSFYRKNTSVTIQKFDLNSCYGQISNSNDFFEVYYSSIDPLLKEKNDFLKK